MSDYKYLSWYDLQFRKHGENVAAYVDEATNPDLGAFLDHQFQQVVNAADAGCSNEPRWRELQGTAIKAKEALESGDTQRIAIAFCALGSAIETLQHPTHDELLELYKADLVEAKRKAPLVRKSAGSQALKEIAQEYAERAWADDTNKSIRIGEMCEIVYNVIVTAAHENNNKDMVSALPDKAEGIKPWLREVAPKHAKKGGRPKE